MSTTETEGQETLPLSCKEAPTVKRVVAFYLKDYLQGMRREPSTIATQRSALNWLATHLPPFPTPGQVQMAIQGKLDSGRICEATANNYRKFLSHSYEYARNNWPTITIRNPCESFPTWKVPQRRPRGMADPVGTFQRLLEEACTDDKERGLLCVLTLLALRISEARGLQWERDLDKEYKTLTVRRQRSQGRKAEKGLKTDASFATFDVPEELRGYLRSMWRERIRVRNATTGQDANGTLWKEAQSPHVFPFGQKRLGALLKRIREVAPSDFPRGLAWHGFRDSMGAMLVQQEASLEEGQRALRHASKANTALYYENFKGKETNTSALKGVQGLFTKRPEVAGSGLRLLK